MKTFLIVTAICSTLLMFMFVFYKILSMPLLELSQELNIKPVIVWWTKRPDLPVPESYITCSSVGHSKKNQVCLISENTTRKNIDAFLFYGPEIDFEDLPYPRFSHTIWGLYADEPPKRTEFFYDDTLNLFNFSCTFSRYSDVPIPLQGLRVDVTVLKTPLFYMDTRHKNLLLNAIAPVLYIQTKPLKDDYVSELKAHIHIDILHCLNETECRFDDVEILKRISQYKFIITIDSVVCNDYVSDKLWLALRLGVVPIYFGTQTILHWMPNPNSVISAEDFSSPYHLAKHLHQLNNNDEAYEKFLLHKIQGKISNKRLSRELFLRPYQLNFGNSIEMLECLVCRSLHRRSSKKVNKVKKTHFNCTRSYAFMTSTYFTRNQLQQQSLEEYGE